MLRNKKRNTIGCILFHLEERYKPNFVEIDFVYLEKDSRRQGLGKMLLEFCFNESMKEWGIKEFRLWVLASNKRAFEFYKKQGFGAQREEHFPKPVEKGLATRSGKRRLVPVKDDKYLNHRMLLVL